jgi:uncharacterized protein YndB with AHSA1/START domain
MEVMEKLNFKIDINAPKETVWNVLLSKETYSEWTAPFCEGGTSTAETDWKKGSKVLFLDGNGMGMVSKIAENIPNEYISIHHLGIVKDGVEDYDSDEVKKWGDAFENYTLKEENGQTTLLIDMDSNEEYKAMFEKTWPEALQKVKEIAEK